MKVRQKWKHYFSMLRGKIVCMLLAALIIGILVITFLTLFGSAYFVDFHVIIDAIYRVNRLLVSFLQERTEMVAHLDGNASLVPETPELAEPSYKQKIAQTDDLLAALNAKTKEIEERGYITSITQARQSYLAAFDTALLQWNAGIVDTEARAEMMRIGDHIDGYIRTLLQLVVDKGQSVFQRSTTVLWRIALGVIVSIVLYQLCIVLWARWMFRRIVAPICDLTQYVETTMPGTRRMQRHKRGVAEIDMLYAVVSQMQASNERLVQSLEEKREMESRLHAEEMRRVKMEATMDTLRLSVLQSQVNPHFLLNTLNIISRMAQMEGAHRTSDLIVRLSHLFRYSLQSADSVVPLENELTIVTEYLEIQRLRFGERIGFHFRTALNPRNVRVPVFTLQPLIENAVIHGISPREAGGEVFITVGIHADYLVIVVRDTGVGIEKSKLNALMGQYEPSVGHISGLGINNVRQRVLAHCPGSTFTLRSAPNRGTSVILRIPISQGA